MTKYIFITGGVVSSLGKGITAASLAFLLKSRGLNITMQKLDPYFNVDPGTMSPHQHGEVFVTADGTETDLDLGHYERFTGIECSRHSNCTSGRIYLNVIERERSGGYLGKTVQVIPHITDEIKQVIRANAIGADVAIIEIGGTAGDIESLPFLEAARQFSLECGAGNCIFIHLTLLVYLKAVGELKTKPSQQSVGILRNIGILPDILVCRTEMPMTEEERQKLALFCNVPADLVIPEEDIAHSIYEVPLELAKHNLDDKVLNLLQLTAPAADLSDWKNLMQQMINPKYSCNIAIIGKYINCPDSYKSISEALRHAGTHLNCGVKLHLIDAEKESDLSQYDGILIPGGFGSRGVEGKIKAIEFARTHQIPLFGICLGMQCIAIEYARNVLSWPDADSTEFNPDSTHPVIALMPDQRNIKLKGGTMRLGAYICKLRAGSTAEQCYKQAEISERHRHRYEFNNLYREEFAAAGMRISGTSPDESLVEIIELPGQPFYLGCQFHPEFQSRITAPHPLFVKFVQSAIEQKERNR